MHSWIERSTRLATGRKGTIRCSQLVYGLHGRGRIDWLSTSGVVSAVDSAILDRYAGTPGEGKCLLMVSRGGVSANRLYRFGHTFVQNSPRCACSQWGRRLDLSRSVELEVIQQYIEIATQAPAGGNDPRYHFVVVTDSIKRVRLAELYRKLFFEEYLPRRASRAQPTLAFSRDRTLTRHSPYRFMPCWRVGEVRKPPPSCWVATC
jgi:hypothetical protein